ncbi:kinase-like domain-containing protein [Syncephalastrum racemosum]|uniref:Kinase-like domain-containing protein n=1 Tax=Syncephalastrum racemosum TaxID=13706 RepID=A0A1X2HTD4_SYNRA|nr:kinase-like domain-containing protein [Syncephalastrum racemosum]
MASQSLSTSQAASTTTTSMTSTSTAGSGANLSRKAKRQDGIPSSGSSSGHLELEKVPMPGTISASNGLAVAAGPNKQLYFVNGNAQYVTVPLNDLLASASSAQPPGSNGSGDSNDNSRANMPGSALKGGAIAGIVVGCVVGVALIAGLLWFLLRGRRSRRGGTRHLPAFETLPSDKEMSYTFRSAPNSLPTDVGNDDAVRDLRAITSGIVRQLPSEDSGERLLDPHAILAAGTPILAGAYLTTRDPAVILSRDDVEHQPYASRTIQGRNDYETYTMHYFSNQEVFLRAISIASTLGGTRGLAHHHDAVELTGRRHQQQRFRYLWISSPCVAYQSLQSVLHQEESQPRLVNINDYAYKAWSTYSLLESVANMHANGYVHLQLTPLAFYYRDIENVSDWILADMGYARRDNTRVTDLRLNQYSAPELFATATSDNKRCFRQTATQALDVWSLGALIYQLATGHQLTQDLAHMAQLSRRDRDQLFIRVTSACNDAGTVNASYRTLLEGMLQPDPERRLTAASLLDYWRDANGLYDDEHETTTSF